MANHQSGFYVYQLVDPRNGKPFYVGKGQRDRAWQHEKAVRASKPSGGQRKNDLIEEIIKFRHCVEVVIVAEYDDEVDALDHEFRLVDADPTLTNVFPGGGGFTGALDSPIRAQRRREVYEERRKLLLEQKAQAASGRFEERARRLLGRKSAQLHKEELEAWISRMRPLHEKEIEEWTTGVRSLPVEVPKRRKCKGKDHRGKYRSRPKRKSELEPTTPVIPNVMRYLI